MYKIHYLGIKGVVDSIGKIISTRGEQVDFNPWLGCKCFFPIHGWDASMFFQVNFL